jgi:tetratricopeptide (TPR) repeat protein
MADEALEMDPEFIGAIDLKALTSMYMGDYDSALFYYNKIARLEPDQYLAYSGKGHLYMSYLNNPDSAYKYLVKGVNLAPNNPWANLALAQNYSNNQNDILRALPFFNRANLLDGEANPEIGLQIAIAMANIGDYTTGLKFMKKSMDIRMECLMINYYNYLLLCEENYNASNLFLDSLRDINKCVNVCNKQGYLASILQDNIEQAQKYFRGSPETRIYPIFLNDLTNACFFNKTGRKDQADRILERIIDENLNHLKKSLNRSDLSITYWTLCGAFSMLNDKENALHYLVKLEESGFFAGWQDFIMIFPAFENLWDNPQFNEIMKRVLDKKTAIRDQVNELRSTGEIDI